MIDNLAEIDRLELISWDTKRVRELANKFIVYAACHLDPLTRDELLNSDKSAQLLKIIEARSKEKWFILTKSILFEYQWPNNPYIKDVKGLRISTEPAPKLTLNRKRITNKELFRRLDESCEDIMAWAAYIQGLEVTKRLNPYEVVFPASLCAQNVITVSPITVHTTDQKIIIPLN